MLEITQLYSLLSLAFLLGLVHALDADHIMAVSTLSGSRPGFRQSIAFCSRWAIGHGSALLIVALFVLVLDWGKADAVSHIAEQAVGLILILLGIWVWRDIRRQGLHLHFHQHGKNIIHAHWHEHQPTQEKNSHQHKHSATLVGMVHGVAGSAPLLAIIPMSQFDSVLSSLLYIVIFGLGVFISMLLFGGALGRIFVLIAAKGQGLINLLRGLIASSSIVYGAFLLYRAML